MALHLTRDKKIMKTLKAVINEFEQVIGFTHVENNVKEIHYSSVGEMFMGMIVNAEDLKVSANKKYFKEYFKDYINYGTELSEIIKNIEKYVDLIEERTSKLGFNYYN